MTIKRLNLSVKNVKISSEKKANEINLFDLGTLIHFETHTWQARKRLPKEISKQLTPEAEGDWTTVNKSLINKKHLSDINSIISDARLFVWNNANPFPIKGIHFIPNTRVDIVKQKLNECIIKLDKEIEKFTEEYEQYILEAEKILSPYGLFNPLDYPMDIKKRFSITYRFFELIIPSKLTDEIYKEEQQKFIDLANETRNMGILALKEGFADIVTHLTDTLTGKLDGESKRVRQEAINKFEEFWEIFQSKNIFKDNELEKIIKDAKEIMEGVDKDALKDKELVKLVNDEMLKIKKEVDSSIVSFKRKISFI